MVRNAAPTLARSNDKTVDRSTEYQVLRTGICVWWCHLQNMCNSHWFSTMLSYLRMRDLRIWANETFARSLLITVKSAIKITQFHSDFGRTALTPPRAENCHQFVCMKCNERNASADEAVSNDNSCWKYCARRNEMPLAFQLMRQRSICVNLAKQLLCECVCVCGLCARVFCINFAGERNSHVHHSLSVRWQHTKIKH